MTFSRDDESLLRQLIEVLPLADERKPEAVLSRLEQLQSRLDPENEFAMILSWLGKCRLVHKLGQEQLPLKSPNEYRVPDLLAAFEYEGTIVPVLIEVKTTEPPDPTTLDIGTLSLNRKYLPYAELVGLPMLIAWRYRGFWTLFEMQHAKLKEVNYGIDFSCAGERNLLGVLAGDFSYRLAPGTRIQMRIRKLTKPDPETGGFRGRIHDSHFENPSGNRIPDVPHLLSLFMFWDNEVEEFDDGDDIVQSFVVSDTGCAEFASRTLGQIVHASARLRRSLVSWRSVVHDAKHLAHDSGRLRALVAEGAKHGVITNVMRTFPSSAPSFLDGVR